MRIRVIGYWATTIIIVLELVAGGATDLARGPALLVAGPSVVSALAQLGYPTYLLTILGLWKLLGAIALLVPGFQRLKEWAYAGIIFEMTGAAASWSACGDKGSNLTVPLILALLAVASWALRPPSRTLGALFRAGQRT
ncbi:MAG: DoxX family protein [Terriglobia bacterium]